MLRLLGALYLTLLLRTGNLQNKSELSSAPDGTKPSSADWPKLEGGSSEQSGSVAHSRHLW